MENLPNEIIKIVCDQIDQDIHFIYLTMTCKFCHNFSDYRLLTNRYTFTKILYVVEKYMFTNIYYDCDKFNINVLFCSKLKNLLLCNDYQDCLSSFCFNFPELHEIIPSIFYKNIDTLSLIPDIPIKKKLSMIIISNVFCHEYYDSDFNLYFTENHYHFPAIFNEKSLILINQKFYKSLLPFGIIDRMGDLHRKFNQPSHMKRLKLLCEILKNIDTEMNEYIEYFLVLMFSNIYDFIIFVNTHIKEMNIIIQYLIDMLNMEKIFLNKLYDLIIYKLNLLNIDQYVNYCMINRKIKKNEIKLISPKELYKIQIGSIICCLDKKGLYTIYDSVIKINREYFKVSRIIFFTKNRTGNLKIKKTELSKVDKLWVL